MPARSGRGGRIAVAAAMVGVFAVGLWAAWAFTVDDAFITWRYSANLAAGHGPVWNPGEDPVEGFTNFAWMLWHAPFAALGVSLPLVAKITSAICGLATVVLLVRHAGSRIGALVAAGAYLLFLPTYFHITGGLETAAFALVVLRLAIIGMRVLRGHEVSPWEPPLLLLLAGMLRPEGVLAAVPAVAVWLWLTRSRSAFLWTGVAAVVGAGYFAWRYSFYGQLFPNTFYIKFGNITAGQAWLEATTMALLPLIVLTGALVLLRSTGSIGILFAATIAATWLPIALSGPSMDYVHRFAYHVYPVLCLGAGLALGREVHRRIAAMVGALSVGWVALAGVTADDMPTVVNYSADLQRSHVSIGQGLSRADVPMEDRTLAVSDAGAIPYYSGWNAIDYIGLNDEAIANGESPHVRVTEASPTVIVVTGRGPGPMANAYGLRVDEATEGYVRVADVLTRDNYSQHVYAEREYADEVRSALQPAIDEAVATHDPGRYDLTLDRWLDRLFGRL